jgi:hypothetical protein
MLLRCMRALLRGATGGGRVRRMTLCRLLLCRELSAPRAAALPLPLPLGTTGSMAAMLRQRPEATSLLNLSLQARALRAGLHLALAPSSRAPLLPAVFRPAPAEACSTGAPCSRVMWGGSRPWPLALLQALL